MSRYIADSYLYRAIGADISGRCGKCTKSRTDCMGQSLSVMDICGIIDDAATPNLVEVVRCGECKHYQGNHKTPGCAPCSLRGLGEVMWDDFCKRGERWDG